MTDTPMIEREIVVPDTESGGSPFSWSAAIAGAFAATAVSFLIIALPKPLRAASALRRVCWPSGKRKKPTRWNASRRSTASAYSLSGPPAQPSYPSSSLPTFQRSMYGLGQGKQGDC